MPEVFFDAHEPPSLPPLTPLYGVKPRGLGTGACESLKSYIGRLADAHRVSPRTLMGEVLHDKLVALHGAWKRTYCWRFTGNSSLYIGKGKVTIGLISVLLEATGIEGLQYCTMLPLRGVLNLNSLLASKERYCPLCMRQADSHDDLHGQLIWDVACVKACPVHGVQLVAAGCGYDSDKPLNFSHRKILSGVCSACGAIGYLCNKEPVVIASDAEIWKSQQVAELIASFPLARQFFSKENNIIGLRALTDSMFDGKPAVAARQAGIYKSLLWEWMKGTYLPNLGGLLDLCLLAGVSLVSLMKGNPQKCDGPEPEFESKRRIKEGRLDREERERVLREALVIEPPVSLASVAAGLNVHRTTLQKQFPVLAACVTKRFHRFSLAQREDRHETTKKQARHLITELAMAGLPPTRRNLQNAIGEPLMPNDRLRKVLDEMQLRRLIRAGR